MAFDLVRNGPIGLAVLALALAPGCVPLGDEGQSVGACSIEPLVGQTFDIDVDNPSPQIHAAAVFDGSAIWLTYNLVEPGGNGGFNVYATRLNCDGSVDVPLVGVNTTAGRNDVDPDISLAGDHLVFAWDSDNGTGIDNLDVFFRTYDAAGDARMDSDQLLETTRQGSPVAGNAFMNAIVAEPTGFVLAGSRALEDAGTFQAFVQRVDADGKLAGEAVDAHFQRGVSQMNPALGRAGDGTMLLAWTNAMSVDDERILHSSLKPGATTFDTPTELVTGAMGGGASIASGEHPYFAMHRVAGNEYDIAIRDAASPPLTLGLAGRLDHTPTVVASDDGGVVAWYRNIGGFRNEVYVQRFRHDASGLTATGPETQIVTDMPAAPYPLALTRIGPDLYFVAWSEGTSPDLYLKGVVVRL